MRLTGKRSLNKQKIAGAGIAVNATGDLTLRRQDAKVKRGSGEIVLIVGPKLFIEPGTKAI